MKTKPASSSQSRPAMWGSLLLVLGSSACCWLPLLAITLGFSAVGGAQIFEGLRPYMLALAGVLVLGSLLLRSRSKRLCGQQSCCDDEKTASKRISWRWIAALPLFVAFAFFPEILALNVQTDAEEIPSPVHETLASSLMDAPAKHQEGPLRREYTVTGMTCVGCESTLAMELESRDGIVATTISYEKQSAIIEFTAATDEKTADLIMAEVDDDWGYNFSRKAQPAATLPSPR